MADPKKLSAATRKPKYDAQSVGSYGLREYGGFINEEFLPELTGERGLRVYREMANNDAIVGAVLYAITLMVRQVKWHVQAADDSQEAEDAKTFVEEVIADMDVPMSAVLSEICSMFVYGFAPMEIIWKRRGGFNATDPSQRSKYDDGKIAVRRLALRSQSTVAKWIFDEETEELLGFEQQFIKGGRAFIPANKFILFRTTEEKNNPQGRSVLRTAWRSWTFKKRIEEIEGIGIERDLAGLPVARIPGYMMRSDADPQDKAVALAYQKLITNIRRDRQDGVLLPSDKDKDGNYLFELSLLTSGGSRTFNTSEIIDRWDRRIATSTLADFIFLGQQRVGSFALSSDKTALFATALGGFLDIIVERFNRDLIERLWELNGMNVEVMPRIAHDDIEKPDLAQLGDFIQKLTASGATLFPDRELENDLREKAGLPRAPEDSEDMIDPGMVEDPRSQTVDPYAEQQTEPDQMQQTVKKDSGDMPVAELADEIAGLSARQLEAHNAIDQSAMLMKAMNDGFDAERVKLADAVDRMGDFFTRISGAVEKINDAQMEMGHRIDLLAVKVEQTAAEGREAIAKTREEIAKRTVTKFLTDDNGNIVGSVKEQQ